MIIPFSVRCVSEIFFNSGPGGPEGKKMKTKRKWKTEMGIFGNRKNKAQNELPSRKVNMGKMETGKM